MSRKKLIVPFFKTLLNKPTVILKALYHAVSNNESENKVVKKYPEFREGLPVIDLLDLFGNFDEEVNYFTHLYGTSMPVDMALLKLLAKKFPDCEYLEIGTWRGESIANVAEVAKHCVSELSDKEMHALGYSEKFTRVQRLFSKDFKNIEHIQHNSRTFDFASLNRKFDLIFVDGDHSYEGVKIDTENVFKLLKNENSIIVWHDYTSNYEHIDWEVFGGILDGAPSDKRKNIYQISNTLCAVYMNGNFPTKKLDYPTFPDKTFSLRIRGEKKK